MMPTHRIHTVTFDLDIVGTVPPDAVFDLVSATCQSAIEEVVEASLAGAETGTIARVEVDLGTLPLRRLRADLPRVIRREVSVALHGAARQQRDPASVFEAWLAGREDADTMIEALREIAPQKRSALFATSAARHRAALLDDGRFADLVRQLGVSDAALTALEQVLGLPWQVDISVPVRMELLRLAATRPKEAPDVLEVASQVTGIARDDIEDRLNDQAEGALSGANKDGFYRFRTSIESHPQAAPLIDALLCLDPAIEHRWGPRQRRLAQAARDLLDTAAPPADTPSWIDALTGELGVPQSDEEPQSPRNTETPADTLRFFRLLLTCPIQLYAAVCATPWDMHEEVLELATPGRAGLLLTAIRAAEAEAVPPEVASALWRQLYPVVLDEAAPQAADALLHAVMAQAAIALGLGRKDVAVWLRQGAEAQRHAPDAARFGPLLQMLPEDTARAPAQPREKPTHTNPAPPLSPSATIASYGPAAEVIRALRGGSARLSETLAEALAAGTLDGPEGARALQDAMLSGRGRAALSRIAPDDLRDALFARVLGAHQAEELQEISRLMTRIKLSAPLATHVLLETALRVHAQGASDVLADALRGVSAASGIALPALLAKLRSVAAPPMARRLESLSRQAWRDAVLIPDPTALAASASDPGPTATDAQPDHRRTTPIAGAVLLWPFLPHYVDRLATLSGLHDMPLRAQAVAEIDALLHSGARSQDADTALLKLLLGVPMALPVPRPLEDPDVTAVGHDMLQAVLAAWPKLDGTSVPGLIESFLLRPGLLDMQGDNHRLRVERRPFDMLLDHLPWTLSTLRLSWMTAPLTVVWR